jgi:pyruvate,orthophosphate dikinase
VKLDTELDAKDLKKLVATMKGKGQEAHGPRPAHRPHGTDLGGIEAVFRSWNTPRAITYRKLNAIPDEWGTAVNVQAMVFGNMGEGSATGVAFTRDPATGEHVFYGEYLKNAQGEDVVAGIRTPQPINIKGKRSRTDVSMEEALPGQYHQLVEIYETLEKHYRDMQAIEFTVQEGNLWMLQTRTGKRTAAAAVHIAVDMVNEGLITKREAVGRVNPDQIDQLLHPQIDPKAKKKVIGKGLPASPGAAVGRVVFSAEDAEVEAKKGAKVILVRVETSPEDIHGMNVAQGILTARGGMTSHAAVVARGMGKCCVSGVPDLNVDYSKQKFTLGGQTVKKGDFMSLDGTRGEVILGECGTTPPSLSGAFGTLMKWADEYRTLGGAHQRRYAQGRTGGPRVRGRGHRPVPDRAHVLRGRPHPGRARDDLGQRRERSQEGPRQDQTHAEGRLQGDIQGHEGTARDHTPAGPPAARVFSPTPMPSWPRWPRPSGRPLPRSGPSATRSTKPTPCWATVAAGWA